jgi:hypothetical protein
MTHTQSAKKTHRIDSNNELITNKNAKLAGTWSLTSNHDLSYVLEHTDDTKSGKTYKLSGKIKDVDANSLTFALDTKNPSTQDWEDTITLKGVWQADRFNRLVFNVKKESGPNDILTFKNTWTINKHHHLIYTYKRADLTRKHYKNHTLVFKGYWNIPDKRRVYYQLENQPNTGFEFSFGGAKLKKNRIKLKLMIGARPQTKTITLKGQWKVSPELGLGFDMEYENQKVHTALKADIALTGKNKFSLKLLEKGFGVKFTQKVLKNLDTFVAYDRKKEDYDMKLGIRVKF